MSTTIEDRAVLLLKWQLDVVAPDGSAAADVTDEIRSIWAAADHSLLGGHGFWERLHVFTGISAQRWRKTFTRRQRATPDMIEALARAFPQHAFWLATGITDATNGHVAPVIAQAFPERLYMEDASATGYFRCALTLMRRLFDEATVNRDDTRQRMCASERIYSLGRWHDGPVCDAAYRVARSQEYAELERLWAEREKNRRHHLDCIVGKSRPQKPGRETARANQSFSTPLQFTDPRTAHQDRWDLFYRALERPTTFALSVLNIAPVDLSADALRALTQWLKNMGNGDFGILIRYLVSHGIALDAVIDPRRDTVQYAASTLNDAEIKRFVRLVMKLKKTRR